MIIATIFTFSVGEQTQAPRFYEYLADLAPKGQAALLPGFAFLPIAIAWTLGGTFGGWIYHSYGRKEVGQPETVFLIIGLVGIVAAIMMFFYNVYMKKIKYGVVFPLHWGHFDLKWLNYKIYQSV